MKPAEFLAKYVALLAGGAVAVLATGAVHHGREVALWNRVLAHSPPRSGAGALLR